MFKKYSLVCLAMLSQVATTESAEQVKSDQPKSKYKRMAEQLGEDRKASLKIREEIHKEADEAMEKIAEINQQTKKLEDNLTTYQQKKPEAENKMLEVVTQINKNLDMKNKEISQLNSGLESLSLDVQNMKDDLAKKEKKLKEKKGEIKFLKSQKSELSQNLVDAKNQLAEQGNALEGLGKTLRDKGLENQELKQAVDGLQEKLNADAQEKTKLEREKSAIEEQLSNRQGNEEQLKVNLEHHIKQIFILNQEMQGLEGESRQLNEKLAHSNEELNTLKVKYDKLAMENKDLKSQVSQMSEETKCQIGQICESNITIESLKKQLTQVQSEIDQFMTEREILNKKLESMGFSYDQIEFFLKRLVSEAFIIKTAEQEEYSNNEKALMREEIKALNNKVDLNSQAITQILEISKNATTGLVSSDELKNVNLRLSNALNQVDQTHQAKLEELNTKLDEKINQMIKSKKSKNTIRANSPSKGSKGSGETKIITNNGNIEEKK